jgi:hypothetical protein
MAPAPTRTKRWFRKNGWFTEREEYILCNRAIRDDPSKGDMTNRDPITLPLLWKSLCDFDMWPIYVYGLTWEVSSDAVDRVSLIELPRSQLIISTSLSICVIMGSTLSIPISSPSLPMSEVSSPWRPSPTHP